MGAFPAPPADAKRNRKVPCKISAFLTHTQIVIRLTTVLLLGSFILGFISIYYISLLGWLSTNQKIDPNGLLIIVSCWKKNSFPSWSWLSWQYITSLCVCQITRKLLVGKTKTKKSRSERRHYFDWARVLDGVTGRSSWNVVFIGMIGTPGVVQGSQVEAVWSS